MGTFAMSNTKKVISIICLSTLFVGGISGIDTNAKKPTTSVRTHYRTSKNGNVSVVSKHVRRYKKRGE